MLARHESTITVADSCQSLSPGPTPKKRPYTQVFSTPVASRIITSGSRSTPPSPLKNVHQIGRGNNDIIRKHRCIEAGQTLGQSQGKRASCGGEQITWDYLDGLLKDAEWLSEQMSRLLSETKHLMSTEAYGGSVRTAQEDYQRLLRAGDFDDKDMTEIATQYIIDRHLIRTKRHLRRLDAESRMLVLAQSDLCLIPDATHSPTECVPPTPPESHPGISEHEATQTDSRSESSEVPMRRVYERSASPCDNLAVDAEPELPPWPASGAKESHLSDVMDHHSKEFDIVTDTLHTDVLPKRQRRSTRLANRQDDEKDDI